MISYETIVCSDNTICGEDTICGAPLSLAHDMLMFRYYNVGPLIEEIPSGGSNEPVVIYDTDGNEIQSGSVTVEMLVDGVLTPVEINAQYIIDGTNVELTSGIYPFNAGNDNSVMFLITNGGTLIIAGTENEFVKIQKSGNATGDEINSIIFLEGENTSAVLNYTNLVSVSNNAIGISAVNGAAITANNVNITTQGKNAPAIFVDTNSSIFGTNLVLMTYGEASPLIYTKGTSIIEDSTGTSNGSQIAWVEDSGILNLTSCDFACDGMGHIKGKSERKCRDHMIDSCGIFIYQKIKNNSNISQINLTDCRLKINIYNCSMFMVTNTETNISLNDNTFYFYKRPWLIIAEETSQIGEKGSNDGIINLTLTKQSVDRCLAFVGGSGSELYISSTDGSKTNIQIIRQSW